MSSGHHTSFAKHLASLDESRLETILRHRPEAMARPWPGTLAEVIARLGSPGSIRATYEQLPLPHVELLGAISMLQVIGQRVTVDELAKQFGSDSAVVRPAIDDLADRALIWIDTDGTVRAVSRFAGIGIPDGWPIALLLVECTVRSLQNIAGWLELDRHGSKADLIDRITHLFRDSARLLEVIESGPADDLIRRIDAGEAVPFFDGLGRPTPEVQWAADRALIWPGETSLAEAPLEVTLALAGPDSQWPFHPHPPPPVLTDIDPEHVEHESRAAMLRLVERVTQLIEAVERDPIPLTRNGMVTVKTMRAYAKQWACTADDSAFVFAITLLMLFIAPVAESAPTRRRTASSPGPPVLKHTGEVGRWHDADTVERARMLAETWWHATTPMIVHSRQAQSGPGRYQQLRRAVVGVYAAVGNGSRLEDFLAQLEWRSPLLIENRDVVDRVLREAALVGAIAMGSASNLGRALIAGDPSDALNAVAESAQSTATFGTDLTAVVFGLPDTSIAGLLDAMATREAQGAATTWRFSPESVRRAFDAGSSAESLLADLTSVAANGIPQPLEYLLSDVERTYGNLVVAAVQCVVTSSEHALLHEVSAHRKLQGLGLRLLAPGVLASNATPQETLSALRTAGYSPIPEGGVVSVAKSTPVRTTKTVDSNVPGPDLLWHAKHLLEAPDDSMSPEFFMIVQMLSGRCSSYELLMKLARGGVARLVSGSDEHVVHSPRVRGGNVRFWSATTTNYETFSAQAIQLSELAALD